MHINTPHYNHKGLTISKTLHKEQKSERLSNIELLRIVAMFMVLIVHADFSALGTPTLNEFANNIIGAYTRTFIEYLSICCVNVFVMISGWFGIKTKIKGIISFIFQCCFIFLLVYILAVGLQYATFNLKYLAQCFLLLKDNWFVKSYLLLYIIAPILNSFCNNASKRIFLSVLLGFFLFQTIFGYIFDSVSFFEGGYSTMSFIGLYLLARYMNIHNPKCANLSAQTYIFVYVGLALLETLILWIMLKLNIDRTMMIGAYVSPLVIIQSCSLLLLFRSFKLKSQVINIVAKSAFSVYLVHTAPGIFHDVFLKGMKSLYVNFNGLHCLLLMFLCLAGIYTIACIIDSIRIYIWNYVCSRILYSSIKLRTID